VIRNLGILTAGVFAFWAVLAGLAYLCWEPMLAGSDLTYQAALGHSLVALLLCLVPAAATLAWASWGHDKSPEAQVAAVLGGSGVRMFFVLGAGMLLTSLVPSFQRPGFWIWVLLFYLFTLALEMVLLVRARPAGTGK
jgi:hypothetical protein